MFLKNINTHDVLVLGTAKITIVPQVPEQIDHIGPIGRPQISFHLLSEFIFFITKQVTINEPHKILQIIFNRLDIGAYSLRFGFLK